MKLVRREPHGFTLIELLVVVAIISILMGVLLPSLSQARQTSRRVVCAAHMRELGNCFTLYGQEYGGVIAVSASSGSSSADIQTLFWCYKQSGAIPAGTRKESLFTPYFRGQGMYQCPEAVVRGMKDNIANLVAVWQDDPTTPTNSVHYCMPTNLGSYQGRYPKITQFMTPSETVLSFDVGLYSVATGTFSTSISLTPNMYASNLASPTTSYTTRSAPNFHGRHGGTGNVLWIDGHVESMKPKMPTISTYMNSSIRSYGPDAYNAVNLGHILRDGNDMATPMQANWYFFSNRDAAIVTPAAQ